MAAMIDPGGRSSDSLAVRAGMKLRGPFDRLFARSSLIPLTPYLDPRTFPWTSTLEEGWRDARAELDQLLNDREELPPLAKLSPVDRPIAADGKWKSYFFKAYGYRADKNIARCPKTAALIDSIPNVVVAFFSVMDAGTHVPRHRGVTKALLNVHLGLRIPAGVDRCRISVGNQVRGWSEGDVLVLDDTYPHEVWNETDQLRAVLFLQVRRPLGPFGWLLASLILRAVRLTSYVQQGKKLLDA